MCSFLKKILLVSVSVQCFVLLAATAPVGTIDVAGMNAAQKSRVDSYMSSLTTYMANRGATVMPILDTSGMNAAQKDRVRRFLLDNHLSSSGVAIDPVLMQDRRSTEQALTELAEREQSVRDRHSVLPSGYAEQAMPDLAAKSQEELKRLQQSTALQMQQLDDYEATQARSSAGLTATKSVTGSANSGVVTPNASVGQSGRLTNYSASVQAVKNSFGRAGSNKSLDYRIDKKKGKLVSEMLEKQVLTEVQYKQMLTESILEHAIGRFTDGLKERSGKAEVLINIKLPLKTGYDPGLGKDKEYASVKFFGRYLKYELKQFVANLGCSGVLNGNVGARYQAHLAVVAQIKAKVLQEVLDYFSGPNVAAINTVDVKGAALTISAQDLADELADAVEAWMHDDILQIAAASSQRASRSADRSVVSSASPEPLDPLLQK